MSLLHPARAGRRFGSDGDRSCYEQLEEIIRGYPGGQRGELASDNSWRDCIWRDASDVSSVLSVRLTGLNAALFRLSMHSVTPSDPIPPSTPSGDPPNKARSRTSLLPPWLEKGESYFDFPRGEPSRGRSIQQSPLLPSIMAVQSPVAPPLPFQDLPVPEAVEPLFEMELGEPVGPQQSYHQYATISGAGRRRMRSDSGPWTSHGWPGSMSPDGHIEHKEYVGSISPAQEWLPRSFYQSRKDAHPFDQMDVVNDQPHSGSSRRSSMLTNMWEHPQRRITTQPSSTSRADRRRSAL